VVEWEEYTDANVVVCSDKCTEVILRPRRLPHRRLANHQWLAASELAVESLGIERVPHLDITSISCEFLVVSCIPSLPIEERHIPTYL
jgi:hypothetical protein